MAISKWAKLSLVAPVLVGAAFALNQPDKADADSDTNFDVGAFAILNNNGTKDYITIGEVSAKDRIDIYSDKAMKKKIYGTTVKTTGVLKIKTSKLSDRGGNLYVKYKKSWLQSADTGVVPYVASPAYTPALQNASTLELTNIKNGNDILEISKPIKGATYRVYEDAKKKKRLLQATAKSTATMSLSIEVPKDYSLHMPQTVYVSVQEKGKKESALLDYTSVDPEGLAPLKASQVTVTNNKDYADVIKITGIQSNDMITVRSTTAPFHTYVLDRKSKGSTMSIYVDQLSKQGKTLEIIHTPALGTSNPKSLKVKYAAEK